VGGNGSLTDTSETGMVDQTGITVLNGFPCPNLVDSGSGRGGEEVVKGWLPYLDAGYLIAVGWRRDEDAPLLGNHWHEQKVK